MAWCALMPLRFVQHLIARGRLTEAQGQDVLHALSRPGTTVDTAVLESGLVPEGDVLDALGEVSGLRPVNLADFEPNPQVSALLPRHIAERWCVTPLSVDGPALHVACAYPVPRTELDEMGVLLGRPLELWIATELRVRDWISSVYSTSLSPRLWNLLARLDPGRSSLHPPPPAGQSAATQATQATETQALQPAATQAVQSTATQDSQSTATQTAQSTVTQSTATQDTRTQDTQSTATQGGSGSDATSTGSRAPQSAARAGEAPGADGSERPQLQPPAASAPAAHDPSGLRSDQELAIHEAAPGQPSSTRRITPLPAGKTRAAPWLPPSLQAAVERGEDISAQLAASPAAAKLAWSVPARPSSTSRSSATTLPRIAGGGSASAKAPAITAPPPEAPRPAAGEPAATERSVAPPSGEAASAPAPTGSPTPRAEVPPGSQARTAGNEVRPLPRVEPAAAPAGQAWPPGTPEQAFVTLTPSPEAPEGARIDATGAAGSDSTAETEEIPDWTLAQARAVLRENARDRDKLLDVILRYARRTFEFAGVFAVLRGEAAGWRSRGGASGDPDFHQVRIPLDAPSIFRTVSLTRGSYVGGLPGDANSAGYLATFGRSPPRAVLVVPVEVRSRLVALVYGDNGGRPISQRRLADFMLFCQELPAAFQQLVQLRRQRDGVDTAPGPDADPGTTAPEAGSSPVPESTATQPRVTSGWAAFDASEHQSLGRAASVPPTLPMQEYVPSDFGPLLRRLTGPDAAGRLRAVAELARIPDASARALARAFPGPTAWSRMPVAELPEADELGPIPGALARLGRAGAGALAPLLDSDDGDTRYLALLTAGSLPYPVLVDGILRGLFDLEPDISSAARAAAAALKRVPRLDASMRGLRQELTSRDPLRRSLAARALGAMHDRDAIDGLIGLTGSDDEMCAQAAADALREITRASFGLQQRSWSMWWVENRGRRRSEWLVAALRHGELDVRVAAFEELARILGDGLGYQPEVSSSEREPAVRRWQAALNDPLRGRRLATL